MKRAPFFAIWLALTLLTMTALATENRTGLTTQVLTATPVRTVVAAELDAAAMLQRLNFPEPGEHLTDGLGMLLAIAGHGAPSANVLSLELGEAVAGTFSVDERDIASNTNELVILGEPAIFHDLRLVALNYRPLLRDPDGVVHIVTYLEVEVTTSAGASVNEHNDPASFSSAFASIYRATISNLDELYPEMTLRPPGRYLVILSTAMYDNIDSTAHWLNWTNLKRRKGYELQITTLGMIQQQFGSSGNHAIKQYIQQQYALGDLEYLMLLGDTADVQTWIAENPEYNDGPTIEVKVGDNEYLTVDGNDYLPDILCGRVSVNTESDIARYFSKVYGYETNPYRTNTHWFETAIFVAGNYSEGTFPVTPVWNVKWARDRLLQSGCITDADTFFYHNGDDPQPGYWTQPLRDSINAGACLVIYRGWAAQPGWQYPVFGNDDVDEGDLHTGKRTPAFFTIVCGSADFAWSGGKCFGETMTVGSIGSVQTPNGAIVYYGATDVHTNTRHNNAVLAGITDALLLDDLRSSTAIAAVGEMLAYAQFPLERVPLAGDTNSFVEYYVFHVFNLLGDPETQIYVCQPHDFTLSYPTLNSGTSLVDVNVQSGGQPVSNAVVTLRAGHNGAVQSAVTDGSGHAWVPADLRNVSLAQLTAWKGEYFMQLVDSIPVTAADFDPLITGINWQDGGEPNPGETISFTLNAQYLGASASDVNVTLTSLDPRLTIINGTGSFGNMVPGQEGPSSAMSIALGGEIADGEHLHVQVLLSGNGNVTRVIEVPVSAPDPVLISLTVNDGNGILEPNETASVTVTLLNAGHQNAGNLTATVYSWDNAVTFPDNQIAWGPVNVDQSVISSDPFQVTLANGVTPGRQIQLRFAISNNGTLLGVRGLTLTTGVVTIHAPTGPDAYGYYAYENIDVGFGNATPTYEWVELDPAFGGSGDATADTVRDETYFMKPLQVPFTFYGQSFSNIWICSNGWLSFEDPLVPEFRNWELPMTMAPWLLISPFWDDLEGDTTSNRPPVGNLWNLWTRWDAPNRYIIMWRAYARECLTPNGNDCPEVFEAILEYNASGDGSILFQYKDIVQVDRGRHSNFATVGIQNYYLQTGLNLTYANFYPATVAPLEDERAIRFTTTPPDGFTGAKAPGEPIPTVFALHEAYPNPFNPQTELRFDLPESGHVTLKVFDVLGREQAVLVDEFRAAGLYRTTFDARSLPSGLYFARLESHGHAQVQKLMLVK